MDIAVSVLGYSLDLSVGLGNVISFIAGAVLMFAFDRWVLGRKVRANLRTAEQKIVAHEARLSVLERVSHTDENRQEIAEHQSQPVSQTAPAADIHDSRRAQDLWRTSPGAGYLAAKLIMQVPTLEEVRETYSAFRAAPRREDSALVNWAFLYRLEEAGHGDEVYGWAFELTGEQEEIIVDDETQAKIMSWREQPPAQDQ